MFDQESADSANDFDLGGAVSEIAGQIAEREVEAPEVEEVHVDEIEETPEAPEVEEVKPEVEVTPAPASWSKDKHEFWGKMPKEAQDYYLVREKQMLDGLEQYKGDAGLGKQMKEVFTPYKAFLNAQGIDEPKAAQYLMNAHYKLSSAQPAEKQAYFAQLARSYGIDIGGTQEQSDIDPNVKALQDKVYALESNLTQREQAQINETRSKVTKDVEAFASDPKHIYFDEVADDIVAHLNAGASLQDAYEKAVWANPVTRTKELARVQTETETKFKEKASKEAAAAKLATSTNVRSRDTGKAPTAPRGTMEDTMRETLKKIQERT